MAARLSSGDKAMAGQDTKYKSYCLINFY